jgi:hypothetical protein
MASSQHAGRWMKACGLSSTSEAPQYSGWSSVPMSPMSWYSGSQLTTTSSSRIEKA